ncbi:hypothetical protein LAZ67_15003050 [Cordylochernes scorpioides]|uniref:Reverse transcriptase domain-containing protein n=1 Tax=Cordylochernes scorpioides TaxID=51811 RepID=A0ABY6LA88_9ARAC|nr:hypothetical protein LAZ67_15003050 [Cordylochernes scorpioides]
MEPEQQLYIPKIENDRCDRDVERHLRLFIEHYNYKSNERASVHGCEVFKCSFTPPSLRVKDPVKNHYSSAIIHSTQKQLLYSRIRGSHAIIRFLQKTIRGLLWLLSSRTHPHELTSLLQTITARVNSQNSTIDFRHQKKFEFWAKKYGFPLHPPTSSKDTIINLTDIKFSDPQTSLLMKGLTFRLPRESDPLYTISCIESALQHQSHTDKFRIRSFIASKLQSTPRKSSLNLRCNNQDITALKSLKAQHDILITKSDKGSQTYQRHHFRPVSNFHLQYFRCPLHIQPAKDPQARHPPQAHCCLPPSPAFPLAKYLCTLLKPLVSSHNIHSVKDPTDFISRLRNIPRSDCLAMSTFDVTSLFLCLPHSLIIEGLKQLLLSSTFPTNEQQVILDLFNICLALDTLEFHGSFFIQTRGSPMGSPLSTVVAEIVMSNLDRWILSQNYLGIELWTRYVDDIFCLQCETDHLPILNALNSYNPDLHVLIINTEHTFHTTIYRKLNSAPSYLHFKSHAPISHKITTVKTISKRIYTHCSLDCFKKNEKRIVYNHLSSAGYPHDFIRQHFYSPNSAKTVLPPYKDLCVLPVTSEKLVDLSAPDYLNTAATYAPMTASLSYASTSQNFTTRSIWTALRHRYLIAGELSFTAIMAYCYIVGRDLLPPKDGSRKAIKMPYDPENHTKMLCGEDPTCTFCNSKLKNEITHYIFDCSALKEEPLCSKLGNSVLHFHQ